MSRITCLPKVFIVTACKKMTLAPSKKLAPKCQPLFDRTNLGLLGKTFRYNGCQHTTPPLNKGAPYPITEEPIPCPYQPRLRSGLTIPHTANPSSGSLRKSEKALFISSIIFSLTRKLENQLQSEAGISFVEYMVLAMLSESNESFPHHDRAGSYYQHPPGTPLPRCGTPGEGRLRPPLPQRRRPPRQHLPLAPAGEQKVQEVAPGHVGEVRRQIFDHLTTEQVEHLAEIGEAVLGDALKRHLLD